MISGAFSLTRQAIQLGYLPRVSRCGTPRSSERGQIYIPEINYLLMGLTMLVVGMFRNSAALAAASAESRGHVDDGGHERLPVHRAQGGAAVPRRRGGRREQIFAIDVLFCLRERDEDRPWRLVPAAPRGGDRRRDDHLGRRPAASHRAPTRDLEQLRGGSLPAPAPIVR